jgi:hypothetical protein
MPSPRSGLSLAATVLAGAALAAAPASAATRNCNVQHDASTFGVTYVTSLKVTNTSCARGKKVIRAFTKCRKRHGGIRGRCPRTTSVLGYHCRERRTAIATQFSSKVVCTAGTRRVVFTYTQNT